MLNSSIKEAAARFVQKAKSLVSTSGIKEPPIDPQVLAQLQGINRIIKSPTLGVSGQLLRNGSELVIKLNANEPVERQRFTCCHEIAHTFFLDGELAKFRTAPHVLSCSRFSPEERFCDLAASEMLMPEKFFGPLAASLEPSIDSVVRLARHFSTSITSTIVRIGQLAVWPVVFVVWKIATRDGSNPKLRVSWSVRPAGRKCFVPLHAPVHSNSGIYATFLTGSPTLEHEQLNLGSLRGKYAIENGKLGHYVVSIVRQPKL